MIIANPIYDTVFKYMMAIIYGRRQQTIADKEIEKLICVSYLWERPNLRWLH